MSNFDDLMEIEGLEEAKSSPISPLFTVGSGDELSKWVQNTFISLMKRNKSYFEEIRENLKLYKGQVFDLPKGSSGSRLTSEMDPQLEKARNTKLYVNKIYDLVEFRVTTHNAAKPGIDIGPAGLEWEDRVGAQLAKAVVDAVWYEQDEDEVERTALRHTFLAGEHYVGPHWDSEKGDINPDYKQWAESMKNKVDQAKSMKLVDKATGKEINYDSDKPLKNGDIGYKHFPAWQVLPEPAASWNKVNYMFTWDSEYIDVLKKQHPKKKDLIKSLEEQQKVEGFDDEFLKRLRGDGKTIILCIWHKRCEYLPNGRFIKATLDGKILVDKDLPYEHEELPFVRLTDLDIPGELRGKSFLRNIKGMQWQHYFLTSMTAANLRLMGYPKWVYEMGSLQIKDFANVRNCLGVRAGAQLKPYILQPNPTGPEVYKQIGDLEVKMDTLVKGAFSNPAAIPKRTDSAAAFAYLDSKDNQRSHTMFSKVDKFRVDLARQTIFVTGQFYNATDGRLVRIVGKGHEYELKQFNFENFKRPYDIRVAADPGMPKDKNERQKFIAGIVKEFPPGTFTKEEIMDWLDLGSTDKMFDMSTKSLKAAESIIQDLLTGNPVPPPEGYEDLLTYWKTFGTYIQARQFKEGVPPQNKQAVLDYLGATEAMMWDKAQQNPAFAQILATLALYPLVFTLPPAMPEAPVASETGISMETPVEGAPAPQVEPGAEVHAASELMQATTANDA